MFNRRRSMILALFAALALVLPVVASAQTSRVEGMAIQGDYIKDYTSIYTFTSAITGVGNLVYGELGVAGGGTPNDRAVGAVLGNLWDGRFGTWAIHMRQLTPDLGQGDVTGNPAPGTFGFDPNSHSNESFDLMWGRMFGTTSLGLRLNRSYFQLEAENGALGPLSTLKFDLPSGTDPNLSRNILGFAGGLGVEVSPTFNFEGSVLYQSRTYEVTYTNGPSATDDGPSTYQLAARGMWQWQPNVMVVPVFKWSSYDLSTKDTTGTTADNSMSGWQLGLAGDWTLGSNDLFVLGLTLAQNRIETKSDIFGFGFDDGKITETFTPQIFAALETHVNNWLTLRFGANKGAWHSIEAENNDAPSKLKLKDSPFSMSLGAGMKVGTLQIDAVLNDAFPHNFPYVISGNTTSPLFPKVTATYSF